MSQIVGDGEHETGKSLSARNPILAQAMRVFCQGATQGVKQPTGGITYSVERGGDCLADPTGIERYPPSFSNDDFLEHIIHLPRPEFIAHCTQNVQKTSHFR